MIQLAYTENFSTKGGHMAQQNYVQYQVPHDVDRRLREYQARIAANRGVSITKVSRSGDVLRALLAIAESAEQLGVLPSATNGAAGEQAA